MKDQHKQSMNTALQRLIWMISSSGCHQQQQESILCKAQRSVFRLRRVSLRISWPQLFRMDLLHTFEPKE